MIGPCRESVLRVSALHRYHRWRFVAPPAANSMGFSQILSDSLRFFYINSNISAGDFLPPPSPALSQRSRWRQTAV